MYTLQYQVIVAILAFDIFSIFPRLDRHIVTLNNLYTVYAGNAQIPTTLHRYAFNEFGHQKFRVQHIDQQGNGH